MASNYAESVVFWCEWLQFTLIGFLKTECVTFMHVNYHALGLTTTYIPPVLYFDPGIEILWNSVSPLQSGSSQSVIC